MLHRIVNSLLAMNLYVLGRMSALTKRVRVLLAPKVAEIDLRGIKIRLLNATRDDLTTSLIRESSDWEADELNLFTVAIGQATTFIDIGANIGLYSILAEKLNPSVRSFAFEPAPANAQRLRKNLELNNCQHCTLVEAAVGDKDDKLTFFVPSDESSTTVSSANKEFTGAWHGNVKEIQVDQMTLDGFVQKNPLQKIELIKLDAEYHELSVLNGAREMLRSHKPAIMCEVHLYETLVHHKPAMRDRVSKTLSYDIEAFFKNAGYYIYAIGHEGIMRVESAHVHPDARNFLFSAVCSESLFLPYTDVHGIAALIRLPDP